MHRRRVGRDSRPLARERRAGEHPSSERALGLGRQRRADAADRWRMERRQRSRQPRNGGREKMGRMAGWGAAPMRLCGADGFGWEADGDWGMGERGLGFSQVVPLSSSFVGPSWAGGSIVFLFFRIPMGPHGANSSPGPTQPNFRDPPRPPDGAKLAPIPAFYGAVPRGALLIWGFLPT